MSSVYIVTSGEYSDRSIDAVFSTEERAQEFIDKAGEGEIGLWEVDWHAERSRLPAWHAFANFERSEVVQANKASMLHWAAPGQRSETQPCGTSGTYVWSFVSHEHAVKVAAEVLQEHRAKQALEAIP